MTENLHGAIPAVEPYHSYKQFLNAVEPEYALLKHNYMRALLKRGETAATWFPPGTDVITTTTIRDEKLNLLSWERELEHVLAFEPAYHIPTDYSTYEDQDIENRCHNVIKCLEGTLWMQRQLQEQRADTQLIPLVKGTTEAEWEICGEVLDRAGFEQCVYYATQYFSGGAGIRIEQLVDDLQTIDSLQQIPLLVIGLLSPTYLERVPDSVIAATGQTAWRDRITPTQQTDEAMQQQWREFAASVDRALTNPASTESQPQPRVS